MGHGIKINFNKKFASFNLINLRKILKIYRTNALPFNKN